VVGREFLLRQIVLTRLSVASLCHDDPLLIARCRVKKSSRNASSLPYVRIFSYDLFVFVLYLDDLMMMFSGLLRLVV
jgi:hypothetical protein